ncbi:MAG: aspartate-semialdehyde dehydrogenase, partial [Gammaproteobacteria bacterium]|nr:aspartate-semialdehyde dehydrogenase [Gammaproteobacteria bacterium]
MKKVGLVGWRGMVGSVLMQRMGQENDFDNIEPTFFTTSQAGQAGPDVGKAMTKLQDAYDIDALAKQDIIISCQGGDYTTAVYQKLRSSDWQGYWIDAASTLRMAEDSIIVLDPVNGKVIAQGITDGVK